MDKAQRLARQAEQETARLHDGRATPASGSGDKVKNDVRTPEWSIEVKSTSKLSYSLKVADLTVAVKQALMDGRRMAFVIAFLGGPGTRPGRYVVMTEDDFLEREHTIAQLKEDAWAYNDLRNS